MLHRGRIGGGKSGIGRKLFEAHFKGDWAIVEGNSLAVVGELERSDFPKRVADFVREVLRIREQLP